MYKTSVELGASGKTADGVHFNDEGIESYIDYIIRKNPEEFNQVGFIGTDSEYKK